MPIYEYRCNACGHDLEVLQKMSDAPLRKCPDCGKSQLRRLVSASRFRLKGSGWYETDFKNKDEKKRNLLGSESSEREAKSDTGTDAAAKTEATKEVAAAKGDGAPESEKPKAAPVKGKKSTAKPRARRSARA
jgi:putative FmdB family regulatory protein